MVKAAAVGEGEGEGSHLEEREELLGRRLGRGLGFAPQEKAEGGGRERGVWSVERGAWFAPREA